MSASVTFCSVCGELCGGNASHNLVDAERDRLALELAKANPVNWDEARWNDTLDRMPKEIAQTRGLAHDFKTWSDAQWFAAMSQAPEGIVAWAPHADAGWSLLDPKKVARVWIDADHTAWRVGYDPDCVSAFFGEDDDDAVARKVFSNGMYPWKDDRAQAFAEALAGVAAVVRDADLRILPGPTPTLRKLPALRQTWRGMPQNLQADVRFVRERPDGRIAACVERVSERQAQRDQKIAPTTVSTLESSGWSVVLKRWRWTIYPGAPFETVGWAETANEAFEETERVLAERGYMVSAGVPKSALDVAVAACDVRAEGPKRI